MPHFRLTLYWEVVRCFHHPYFDPSWFYNPSKHGMIIINWCYYSQTYRFTKDLRENTTRPISLLPKLLGLVWSGRWKSGRIEDLVSLCGFLFWMVPRLNVEEGSWASKDGCLIVSWIGLDSATMLGHFMSQSMHKTWTPQHKHTYTNTYIHIYIGWVNIQGTTNKRSANRTPEILK